MSHTSQDRRAKYVRTRILNTLEQRPYRPIQLLEHLRSPEMSEADLKDALAVLITERVVEFLPDRHIKLHRGRERAAAQ